MVSTTRHPLGDIDENARNQEEGVVERKVKVTKSIGDLRRDLDRISSKYKKVESVDISFQQSTKQQNNAGDIEMKLQELIKQHHSSKTKYKAELETLKSGKATLETSLFDVKTQSRTAQSENAKLRSQLESLRASVSGTTGSEARHVEERAGWSQEKREMIKEIKILRAEVARLRFEGDMVGERVEERDRLEDLLEVVTKECARRTFASVDRREYARIQVDVERLKMEKMERETRESVLRSELKDAKEELCMTRQRLGEAEDHREEAVEMVDQLLRERQLDRLDHISIQPRVLCDIPSLGGTDTDAQELAGLALSHASLASNRLMTQLRDQLVTHKVLLEEHEKGSLSLTSARTTLTALQRSHSQLEAQFFTIQKAHQSCDNNAAGLRAEMSRWQVAEQKLAEELKDSKTEMRRVEDKAKSEREALKRANDGAMRWKSAEGALEDEIESLRTALDEAAQYEEMYHTLLEDHKLLVSREALASEEVETLGAQNAELLGHGNGDQKITYLDGLRREMAITKQELASTRQSLNSANDRIGALMDEVDSYKSVDLRLGLGSSTRTKVVRRVPEGSWLGKIARGTRSVSGPTGK